MLHVVLTPTADGLVRACLMPAKRDLASAKLVRRAIGRQNATWVGEGVFHTAPADCALGTTHLRTCIGVALFDGAGNSALCHFSDAMAMPFAERKRRVPEGSHGDLLHITESAASELGVLERCKDMMPAPPVRAVVLGGTADRPIEWQLALKVFIGAVIALAASRHSCTIEQVVAHVEAGLLALPTLPHLTALPDGGRSLMNSVCAKLLHDSDKDLLAAIVYAPRLFAAVDFPRLDDLHATFSSESLVYRDRFVPHMKGLLTDTIQTAAVAERVREALDRLAIPFVDYSCQRAAVHPNEPGVSCVATRGELFVFPDTMPNPPGCVLMHASLLLTRGLPLPASSGALRTVQRA